MGLNLIAVMILCVSLIGCGAAWRDPQNVDDLNHNQGYMAERRDMPLEKVQYTPEDDDAAIRWNEKRCALPTPSSTAALPDLISDDAMPLSPGDLLRLTLPGNEPPSGNFKVSSNGVLSIDQFGDLPVRGLSPAQAEAALMTKLVLEGFYRAGHAHLALKVLDRAPIRVRVSGAVFQPGQVILNSKSAADRDVTHDTAAGDHALGRALSNALTSAGGVRPDADITRVVVIRGALRQEFDLSGMMFGNEGSDALLADGDRVEVVSRGCFQIALARPSPITMPGVRTFISNLTVPAASNASSAVGNHDATNFPYGTNLLQALVSGNCIGGTQSTNASRYGVLISTNPFNGRTEVIERRVEDLVRRADRDAFNPVILPNDALACYDSTITNARDIANFITAGLLGGAVKP